MTTATVTAAQRPESADVNGRMAPARAPWQRQKRVVTYMPICMYVYQSMVSSSTTATVTAAQRPERADVKGRMAPARAPWQRRRRRVVCTSVYPFIHSCIYLSIDLSIYQ